MAKLYHRVKKPKSGTWTWIACQITDCFYCKKMRYQVITPDNVLRKYQDYTDMDTKILVRSHLGDEE